MIWRRFFLPWTARFTLGISAQPLFFPRRNRTRLASGPTSTTPEIRRLREPVFLIRKWFPVAFLRMTFPVAVRRNRLAAPRWLFIFGTDPDPFVPRGATAFRRRQRLPPRSRPSLPGPSGA